MKAIFVFVLLLLSATACAAEKLPNIVKGQLLDEHYGRDDIFRDRFPEWRKPFVEKAEPFDFSLLE